VLKEMATLHWHEHEGAVFYMVEGRLVAAKSYQ
jgi:quercetin dioxygenase-like cupin family protein